MKNKHTLRLMYAGIAGITVGCMLSGCAGMWLGADTDLNFTQPGGFGIDIGLSSPRIPIGNPFGGPATPPPPGPGPYGPGPGPMGPPPF
ncbi:MAG: hypothetical protein NC411_06150 [Bacteroides sp.]|nr:hypothetical protein [Bacteroides sp.]